MIRWKSWWRGLVWRLCLHDKLRYVCIFEGLEVDGAHREEYLRLPQLPCGKATACGVLQLLLLGLGA